MNGIAKVTLAGTLLLLLAAGASAAPAEDYMVQKKITLGGEGGWDYLTMDAAGRRLFISRGTRVMVVDADSGKLLAEIPDTPGVHGIALAEDLGRGFTSNGRENTVSVFDLKSLKVLSKVKTGENPDAILYDAASKQVFTFNGRSKDATVIDASSGDVLATLPLGGKPEFAVADGRGMVYVNIEDTSELVAIDAKTHKVTARWPLKPCEEPSGLAMDRQKRRLFSGCGNKVMAIVDADSGKLLATAPIGDGVDATAFDPETGLAFSSNGDGTLTIVREEAPGKFTVSANVPTMPRARTMALDTKTHNIYLVTAQFGPAPAPTKEQPRPRPPMVPGTFVLLVVGK
jgi:DNA-binding beta-propeller fold protein YncE